MDERMRAFLEANHLGTMTTFRIDGSAHSVHVAVALVGGKLWSSGTTRRMRTAFLRLNPRYQLLVFPTHEGGYVTYHHGTPGSVFLGLEGNATILEGDDVADQSVELFKVLQPYAVPGTLQWDGGAYSYEEFREIMREEQRVIYEFEVLRSWGRY